MRISIEVVVTQGDWLIPCVESVLFQTDPQWELLLVWNGGTALSRNILEKLDGLNHPQIQVYFQNKRSFTSARRGLTKHSQGEGILPLEEFDRLEENAVKWFREAARFRTNWGILRSQRRFIDEQGRCVQMHDPVPFAERVVHQNLKTGTLHQDQETGIPHQDRKIEILHQDREIEILHQDRETGTLDQDLESGNMYSLYNHTPGYLINREAYKQTAGWDCFQDTTGAGGESDLFAKIEEIASIERLNHQSYVYRLTSRRLETRFGSVQSAATWQWLINTTHRRRGLPVETVENSKILKPVDKPEPVTIPKPVDKPEPVTIPEHIDKPEPVTHQKRGDGPLRILVLTAYTSDLADYGVLTDRNKQTYCQMHHYDFECIRSGFDASRPPAWSKIPFIQQRLANFDYVVWMDADLLIMRPGIPLESLISQYPQDLVIAEEDYGPQQYVNTGVMFVKNTPFCREFLRNVYAQEQFIYHEWWEQKAFTHLLSLKSYREIKRTPQRLFNSMLINDTYREGDFILHFAGLPEKTNLIRDYLAQTTEAPGDMSPGSNI